MNNDPYMNAYYAGIELAHLGEAITVVESFDIRAPFDASPQLGTDDREHATGHGYDGEGVYGWSCLCGAAETDLNGDDGAALAASMHLAELEVLTEVPA